MLAVSFIGKKFCCDAQVEVANEIEGSGLQLNLKVRDACRQFLKSPGPVLATLHVSLDSGRRNDVIKCKELLTFLREQVLPKTVKLISLKRIQNIKDEDKSEGVNLLGCIWPGKSKKRKEENKKKCTRGYSSDTESYPQKSFARSNISNIDDVHQTSNAGILATPMSARTKLAGREKVKSNKNMLGEGKKTSGTKNFQDENITLNHFNEKPPLEKGEKAIVETAHCNFTTSFATKESSTIVRCSGTSCFGYKRAGKLGTGKFHQSETGLQRVQSVQPDWNSCSDISAARSFDGFSILNRSVTSTVKSSMIPEHYLNKQTTRNLEEFAAQYVSKICEVALSRMVKESYEKFAKGFVENVLSLAKSRIVYLERLQHPEQSASCEEIRSMDGEDNPSFSKVWKYSQAFAEGHDFLETRTRIKDPDVKDKELHTSSQLLQRNEAHVLKDGQAGDVENQRMESPLSSNDSLSGTSSSSSSQSLDLYTPCAQEKIETFPPCEIENELNVDYAREKLEGVKMEGGNWEFPLQREDKRNKNTLDVNPNLEKTSYEQTIGTENISCLEEEQNDCFNEAKFEDNETVEISPQSKTEGELQTGAKGSAKLETKKHRNDNQAEPSCSRRRGFYKRTVSESQASERKQWNSTQPGDEDVQTTSNVHGHPSCRPDQTPPKFVRSTSCPVVSEDDVFIESILSHHGDVYDSLGKRTWTILHVHELWNGGKPMDAIKACIELTGMVDVEKDLGTTSKPNAPDALASRDYALFLNILQQLPSSCSMWTLDLCDLVLPKLKGFISTQHHTSHVEMACSIVHVVLKKVAVVVRRTSKGTKDKEKEQKVKVCTNELKDIKDMTSDVIHAVKVRKKNNTEDPVSMKLVLKELQLALGTFLSSASAS